MAKLTSSYPHTTNNFQPQNLFFSVKIIVKHTDEQFKVQNQRRREKRWGEKMLTSLERRLPWLGNTNCIVVSREKKISGLVYTWQFFAFLISCKKARKTTNFSRKSKKIARKLKNDISTLVNYKK